MYKRQVPPPIYSFVHTCDEEDTKAIIFNMSVLRTLAISNLEAVEEVISAYIRNGFKYQMDNTEFLKTVGVNLVSNLPGEMKKVESILKRVTR